MIGVGLTRDGRPRTVWGVLWTVIASTVGGAVTAVGRGSRRFARPPGTLNGALKVARTDAAWQRSGWPASIQVVTAAMAILGDELGGRSSRLPDHASCRAAAMTCPSTGSDSRGMVDIVSEGGVDQKNRQSAPPSLGRQSALTADRLQAVLLQQPVELGDVSVDEVAEGGQLRGELAVQDLEHLDGLDGRQPIGALADR
jgi:hypothetical protein